MFKYSKGLKLIDSFQVMLMLLTYCWTTLLILLNFWTVVYVDTMMKKIVFILERIRWMSIVEFIDGLNFWRFTVECDEYCTFDKWIETVSDINSASALPSSCISIWIKLCYCKLFDECNLLIVEYLRFGVMMNKITVTVN